MEGNVIGHRIAAAVAAGVLTLALAACNGDGSADDGDNGAVGDVEVAVSDNNFSPSNVEVAVGDTVAWTNEGQAPHTVTFEEGPNSGQLAAGESFEHTFDEAGAFTYVCTIHPGMEATVTVTG
jgi:plastocyanin